MMLLNTIPIPKSNLNINLSNQKEMLRLFSRFFFPSKKQFSHKAQPNVLKMSKLSDIPILVGTFSSEQYIKKATLTQTHTQICSSAFI